VKWGGGRERVLGVGGEMAQTMYAHMNKKKERKESLVLPEKVLTITT
jgi:hypothetical protein